MAVSVPSAEHIEARLRQVRGVEAVRVVVNAGEIAEIHVLASLGRPVKQIVRDIEAVCAAVYRIDLDHRRISVAQIEGQAEHCAVIPRPLLSGVRVEYSGNEVTVVVQVGAGAAVYTGQATGRTVNAQRTQLAALATARALCSLLADEAAIELGEVKEFQMAGQRGLAVSLSMAHGATEEKLVGTALIHNDEAIAAARAVLDAVNRRLTAPRPKVGAK